VGQARGGRRPTISGLTISELEQIAPIEQSQNFETTKISKDTKIKQGKVLVFLCVL
jgi:hypothetical protein